MANEANIFFLRVAILVVAIDPLYQVEIAFLPGESLAIIGAPWNS